MPKTINVKGFYRTRNGKREYVRPHTRGISEGKKNFDIFKMPSLEDDEIVDFGDELAYKQGYKRRSIKTSHAIYDRDPKEDKYILGKEALLQLEEDQILERKNIGKNKKDIEIGWKFTKKGRKLFSDSYYDGQEDRGFEIETGLDRE
jgi:hypothetical protein